MELAQDIVSALLVLVGGFFLITGGIGLIRLPDFYTRLHAAGITDTAGAELVLLAMMVQGGFSWVTVKLILIGFFIFITSPSSTHAVANAAFTAGLVPLEADSGPGDSPVGDTAGEGASSNS